MQFLPGHFSQERSHIWMVDLKKSLSSIPYNNLKYRICLETEDYKFTSTVQVFHRTDYFKG